MRICSTCKIEKELDQFHRKGEGHTHMCKECRKTYIKEHYQANIEKYKASAKNSRLSFRKWFRELKSTLKCSKCGENHPACLDFHHENPKEKEISIGLAVVQQWPKHKIISEMNKCIVLCSNCHRKLHSRV
jgi:hypothetical protein